MFTEDAEDVETLVAVEESAVDLAVDADAESRSSVVDTESVEDLEREESVA